MFTRSWAVAALVCLVCPPAAHAQTITDLFNTGVNNSGTPLATNGVIDTHWTNGASNAAYTYINGAYHVYSDADYITINPNGGGGNYTVTFNTTFTLPADAVLSAVSIGGNYSIDNVLDDILINGHSTGIANNNSGNFGAANPFTLPTSFYQTGANTLSVMWSDQGNVGAIAFEFTSKSYSTTAPVPEPGNIALLVGVTMTGAGFLARRRKQTRRTA
jgi:hypothetical protein